MWLVCASALAGDVFAVHLDAEGLEYARVGSTGRDEGPIVTWQDQALELLVVADLSGSILVRDHAVEAFAEMIETFYGAMCARGIASDRIGVTAFATRPQRWIPLGPLDRGGLEDWIGAFDAPKRDLVRDVKFDPDVAWSPWEGLPAPPDPRALDGHDTDAARALRVAIADLADGAPHSAKAIVLLWDGGHNGFDRLGPVLERAWTHEIHVWSVSPTPTLQGPLVTGGGGDAFVTRDLGPWVAERIIAEMGFGLSP